MDEALHKLLMENTERLRKLLACCGTLDVARRIQLYHVRRANDLEYSGGLSSPARQVAFTLGLLLSSSEPQPPLREFDDKSWDRCVNLLQEIFHAYQELMWPSREELPTIDARWREVREVAGQALLHYHNVGFMASVDQVAQRVAAYVSPFDETVRSYWGFSASDALSVCDAICGSIEDANQRMLNLLVEEEAQRSALIDLREAQDLSIEDLRRHVESTSYESTFRELLASIDGFGVVTKKQLEDGFGELGARFWKTFTIGRGDVTLTYLTESNPVDTHPLVTCGPGAAICVSVNVLYEAVLIAGEALLEDANVREVFLRARDKMLERELEGSLVEIMGAEADCHTGLSETPTGVHEHDVVISWRRILIVAEAKASPPKEPFRDLERGFVRLQRAFRSDRGIQKAYEQADRIRERWARGETIRLYDDTGSVALVLEPAEYDEVLTVCVTRDDYGPLATDLSLLLDRRDDSAPYPWAVPILSLQTMAMGWTYLTRGPADFVDFLTVRRQLHGRTICWDELDIVGFHLKHGGLHWLLTPEADLVHINPHYADIFDEIEAALNLGGPPVELEVTEPFMGNVREMMSEMRAELASAKRNDPCPCGSGKKFKRCHGLLSN